MTSAICGTSLGPSSCLNLELRKLCWIPVSRLEIINWSHQKLDLLTLQRMNWKCLRKRMTTVFRLDGLPSRRGEWYSEQMEPGKG